MNSICKIICTSRNKYQLINELGEGSQGKVYKAKNIQNFLVAIKIKEDLSKTENDSIRTLLSKQLNHVIKIFDFEQQGSKFIIVMELAEGSFYYLINNKGIEKQLDYFIQICQGVKELHQLGLIHRNLKPENILYVQQDGQYLLKLKNTGLMRNNFERHKTMKVGTPCYMSPEQITSSLYDEKIDIWALGMLLFERISGNQMFDGIHYFYLFKDKQ